MARKKADPDAKLDRAIEKAWYARAQGVQVNIMDIPLIFRDIRIELSAGTTLDKAVDAAIVLYRKN